MSSPSRVDKLGIPPLAGICSYAAAASPGMRVEETVARLRRYNYIFRRLLEVGAAHQPSTPEWEVKCALGLHMWLDTEHAAGIRARVKEMREPPLHLDDVPDVRLEAAFEELIRAESTAELIGGVYGAIRTALLAAIKSHLALLNPLFDHPTYRLLRGISREQEDVLEWGSAAIKALRPSHGDELNSFMEHVRSYLAAAGGVSGADEAPALSLPHPRWDGSPYEMDAEPRRDQRFKDSFNRSGKIDEYYKDESRPTNERTWALAYVRLREMDVPEWMAPILYKTRGRPWEYYHDLARQLWDETRHAMMGEVSLESLGVPFYTYPIELNFSTALNTHFTPLEAHLILWYIEQGLMQRAGKRYELSVAELHGDAFFEALQDYDWADEVLHAQIGRRWLSPDAQAKERAKSLMAKAMEYYEEYGITRSEGTSWWTKFVESASKGIALRSPTTLDP